MKARLLRSIVLAVSLASVAACSADRVTGPGTAPGLSQRDIETDPNLFGLFGPRLIYCPSSETYTATETVGALGGVVSVAGTTVAIPAGALLGPTAVTVTVPASPYMEIDVSVAGVNHFLFEQPITMTIG